MAELPPDRPEVAIESREAAPDYEAEIAALKARIAKEQAEVDALKGQLAETTTAYRATLSGTVTQRMELDREIAENAGVLGRLRDTAALDSTLGATGLGGGTDSRAKQQLDKEIAEHAGVLGQLRDDATLDSSLGATGLNADMMNGIGGKITENAGVLGSLRDSATLDSPLGARGLGSSTDGYSKQQLDKEIAENAGVLGQLRDVQTLDSTLGATGLNPDMMNGIGATPIVPRGTSIPKNPPEEEK